MNTRTSSSAFERLFLLGLALALTGGIGLLTPASGEAQVCALPTSPKFAGHTLPLDSDPVPEDMRFVRAFPALDYTSLVGLYAAPDNSDRLFAVERNGRIHVFENQDDVASSRVFLDIDPAVDSDASEQGLLGLAFDPDYATNRRFFVNYTASVGCSAPGAAGCSKVVRFEADPADPDRALPNSAFPILEFPQPFDNHNGGAIAFGPDGLLYVATGDGGSGGDPFRNAQNLASRLGKILRLDVRSGAPSLVPATNPYVGVAGTDPLIYHSGLRNPWRMTFDRTTGDLLIADVGQSRREEVHRVRAGGAAGQNFGWDYCEGTRNFRSGALCSDIQSTPPVLEYDHTAPVGGEVIIGGYVYRGDAFPELFGAYLFADAASGHVWAWNGQDPVDPWNPGNPAALIGSAPAGIASFGEDREGELYAVSSVSGQIFRLERSGPGGGGPPFPALLSQTGLFSNVATLTAAPGLIEFDVTTPLWSDGASKRRWMALPGEGRIAFHAREAWEFPVGTAFVKHFELPLIPTGTRRIETRVFLRQTQRWIGVTYRWNSTGTEATLQTDALDETISLGGGTQQDWHYPSTSECLGCHTEVSGRVLGARTRQLEDPRIYAQGTQRQIEAWSCAQLFDFEIGDRSRYEFGRSLADATATRTHRVRSYAAANCEMCHQPGGPAPGDLDLRFTRGVGEWNVIDVPPSEGDLGFPNARRILPGNRFLSIAWLRQAVSDVSVRMARGTRRSDTTAVNLFGDWIVADVASVDSDADGVPDATDVCPAVADPLQVDGDGDSIGDRCDPDALPDLVVAAQTTPTGTVFPGQSLSFSATLENAGAGASGTFPVTFHLSADAILDPAVDIPVGHCWANALAAGGSTACSTSTARIPATFDTGSPNPAPYHWITCANRAEVERDRNPANACSVSPTSVSVPEPRAMLVVALARLALRARNRERHGSSRDRRDVRIARPRAAAAPAVHRCSSCGP